MFIDVYTQTHACAHVHTHTHTQTCTHHYTKALYWENVV